MNKLPCDLCGRLLHAKRFRLVEPSNHNNRSRVSVCLRCEHDRRAGMQIRATPSWANTEEIKRCYECAVSMTTQTGKQFEVDHIIPIISDEVCGLHVEHNLQILTADANRQKANMLTYVQK